MGLLIPHTLCKHYLLSVPGTRSRGIAAVSLPGRCYVARQGCPQATSEAATVRGFHQERRAGPGADPGCPAAFCLRTPSSDCRKRAAVGPPRPGPSPPSSWASAPRGKRRALDTWRCRVRAPGQSLRDRPPSPCHPLPPPALAPGSVSLSWAAQALRRALCAWGGFQLAVCEPFPQVQPTPHRTPHIRGAHSTLAGGQGRGSVWLSQPGQQV